MSDAKYATPNIFCRNCGQPLALMTPGGWVHESEDKAGEPRGWRYNDDPEPEVCRV